MGTFILNVTVVLLPTLFALVIEVVSKEIKEHPHWRLGVITFGIGLSALTGFQLYRNDRIARNDRESAINETSKRVATETTKNVTEAIGKQYNALITMLTKQNSDLQAQLAEENKKVDVIGKSDIVTGKNPVKVIVENQLPPSRSPGAALPDIHVAQMRGEPRPELAKNAAQYILTTNQVMNGGRVTFTCTGEIKNGTATIAGAGGVFGGGRVLDAHTFHADVEAPNWAPDYPLIVDLYYDDNDLGKCTITLR